MFTCILVGILIGIAERFILNVTANKAGRAKASDFSPILYRGMIIRVISISVVLVLGAVVLNETMFVCLVVSYVMTRLTITFAGLWNALVNNKSLVNSTDDFFFGWTR